MRRYATCWTWGWGAVAAVLGAVGLLVAGPVLPVALSLLTLLTVLAWNLGLTTDSRAASPHPWTAPRFRTQLADAAKVAVSVGALAAAASVTGLLVVPLCLLAALTSPWWCRACRRRLDLVTGRTREPGEETIGRASDEVATDDEVAGARPHPGLEALDDADLCRGWCLSFSVLKLARTTSERLEVALLREAYLDELERRHPEALRAWLDAGARPASDPAHHLRAGGTTGAAGPALERPAPLDSHTTDERRSDDSAS
ncbi:hypothetical protein [Nocardioides sp. 1609]|uniref:hypothetical protein n=1 Tax=Nocardioides sp. 1609 TaxID=2508327 RepID=UPI00142FBB9D|nr:hypothetical protein [Nocardioides sp. 1609]